MRTYENTKKIADTAIRNNEAACCDKPMLDPNQVMRPIIASAASTQMNASDSPLFLLIFVQVSGKKNVPSSSAMPIDIDKMLTVDDITSAVISDMLSCTAIPKPIMITMIGTPTVEAIDAQRYCENITSFLFIGMAIWRRSHFEEYFETYPLAMFVMIQYGGITITIMMKNV